MRPETQMDDGEIQTSPVAALLALLDHLRSGTPLGQSDKEFLIDGLSAYLDPEGSLPLEKALGLKRWGGVPPLRAEALAWRDRDLVRVWRAVDRWKSLPPIAAAGLMVLDAERYEAGRWPHEKHDPVPPAEDPAATWWMILSAELKIPKKKRLQQILEAALPD